ncbi:hypothetical protein [Mycobacterium sp. MUNTM1]
MESHLSIFRPYDRDPGHEDQLTRAALIVLKLVLLAHEVFLRLAGCGPLAALPAARFELQTETLVPAGTENETGGVDELVSVFLAPHENLSVQEPNLASQRRARYDGVIQYGAALLVVIESKLYASADDQQSLQINTRGLTPPQKTSRRAIRWNDLLDHWWNLLEASLLLSPAENAVLEDFFTNAEQHFADLLPYTDLERCGEHRGRRLRRLRAILEEATGRDAEVRDTLGHARVKFTPGQVVAFDRVSLFLENNDVVLSAWPAELSAQYTRVYSDPDRAGALIELTADPDWRIAANFHLSFWQASVPRRWYPGRHIRGDDYVRQWVDDYRHKRAGRRPRQELTEPAFRKWLLDRGYAVQEELPGLDEWAAKLPLDKFDVRPSIQVTRSWPLSHAVARDRSGQFVGDVRSAVDELLAALGERSLDTLGR